MRSTVHRAALGTIVLVAAALAAVWATGHYEPFARDRGRLQVLVAIPFASLFAGAALAYSRVINLREMWWAILPVTLLIVLGGGVLGPGPGVWPWLLGLGAVLFVPWVTGGALGWVIRRRDSPGPG